MYKAFRFDSLDLDPRSPFFWDHVSRYWWASEMLAGKTVLDCACGKGYGSYILSHRAAEVLGIDMNERSLEIARDTFHKPNLRFLSADVLRLEQLERPLDVVVAFEVIEHLPPAETDRFLSGIARRLTPGGTLLLSTPNHDVVLKSGAYVPEFHVNNFRATELRAVLRRHFGEVEMLGQFAARPPLEHLLFSLDFWNQRHRLRPRASTLPAEKPPEPASAPDPKWTSYLETFPEEARRYRFSPWHWRQAGLTVAVCRQPGQ